MNAAATNVKRMDGLTSDYRWRLEWERKRADYMLIADAQASTNALSRPTATSH
jgi:hypothetical protein